MTPLKAFQICIVIVVVALAILIAISRFVGGGVHFTQVSTICYGFFLGYLAAWWANYFFIYRKRKQ